MKIHRRLPCGLALLVACFFLAATTRQSQAYIEAPHSFGQVIQLSSNIMVLRVEKVDREKKLIIYKKVEDLKGKDPRDTFKHNVGTPGFHPRESQYSMDGIEPGRIVVFFHNGGASETFTGKYWYQAYAGGEWWTMSHGEPYLFRTYAGSTDKLIAAVRQVLAGKEVVVPCMVNGKLEDLHLRRARIQRLKVSLKLQNYDPKRDFVGWGGEDFRRVSGMPGLTHYSALTRVDPEALGVSAVDFDADGKADLCLVGAGRIGLLQNAGESLNEVSLPGGIGARAAVWADYNGDGLPDLLLATSLGPKLYTNLGKSTFRDDSHLLPKENIGNVTAAAWIDHDGDGRPDILLATGFHGLRLYRNGGAIDTGGAALKVGKWQYIGPFDNSTGNGFGTAYPPEKEIDLAKKYRGKNNEEVKWQEGKFTDGQVNNLALFKDNNNAVVYVYREIECRQAMDLPISLGSDDTLTVWLNGQQQLAVNVARGCTPDQHLLTLKLKPGKNQLLLKVCQGGGEWAFYFANKSTAAPVAHWSFADVSDKVGLGTDGLAGNLRGDTLTVGDVNGDGRPDFLYGTGTGLLVLNTPQGFVEAKDSGIRYRPGKIGPVFADFDNSGRPGLFVPQLDGKSKLFQNDGKGHFTDVTAKAGDLAKFDGMATSAAWGDLDNDGRLDLVIGCLRGPNRFFRNNGNGTFTDQTEAIGLHQRIFNTQGVCLVDLNNDGALDMVFNNEGQDSCVLLGNPTWAAGKQTPVALSVAGRGGVIGSRVRVLGKDGKAVAEQQISGGDSRGGQTAPVARFALKPGTYRVEVRYSSGLVRSKEIAVATTPMRDVIDEPAPKK